MSQLTNLWTLDEGTGSSIADLSGNGGDGTLDDSPAWISGVASNALRFAGTTARAWLNGQCEATGSWTNGVGYEYDRENRLAVATNGAVRIDYRYDPFGRLIERRSSGASASTNRMYYAGWQLIAEYDGGGNLDRKYVYGPGIDEPVLVSGGGTNHFYHADGLGSVTEITDSTGATLETYTYDVYGAPTIRDAGGATIAASAIGNRLMFTARDRDPETELYNYRYRYYSPGLGRFVQVDPIGLAGWDLNLYRYVVNSPGRYIDPVGLLWWEPGSGTWWWDLVITISAGAAIVGAVLAIPATDGLSLIILPTVGAAFTCGLAAFISGGPGPSNPIDAALPPLAPPVGSWLIPPYPPGATPSVPSGSSTNSPPPSPSPPGSCP